VKISGLEQASEIVKSFVEKVLAPPAEEIGQIFAESIRYYRAIKEIKIINKVEAYFKEKNIKTKKISLKLLAPLLEQSSLEEDESLQDKWAALFANTVSEGKDLDTPVYINILSQLTRADAEVFEIIFKNVTSTSGTDSKSVTLKLNTSVKIDDILPGRADAEFIVDNLIRLRLVKEDNPFNSQIANVALTELGFRFMFACKFA
jgi:hypothetical protein